jgi:hypothetical protein
MGALQSLGAWALALFLGKCKVYGHDLRLDFASEWIRSYHCSRCYKWVTKPGVR